MSTEFIIVIAVVLLLVGGVIYYEKIYKPAHPTATTPPIVATVGADVTAAWNSVATELSKLTTALKTSPAPAPATPAGKNGVAGVLTIAVTGDPKIDLPAINAQYFS